MAAVVERLQLFDTDLRGAWLVGANLQAALLAGVHLQEAQRALAGPISSTRSPPGVVPRTRRRLGDANGLECSYVSGAAVLDIPKGRR
jgi:hypothetical protein